MKLKILSVVMLVAFGAIAQEVKPVSVNSEKEWFFAGLKEKLVENWKGAEANFSKIIVANPTSDVAYYELANIAMHQNQFVAAQLNIESAVKLAPKNVWYLKLQAEICKRAGNVEAWLGALDKILVLEPESQQAYIEKANALGVAGRTEAAEKVNALLAEKFGIRFSSEMPKTDSPKNKKDGADVQPVKQLLDESGRLLESGKASEAYELLERAQAATPNNFEVHLAMADVLRALGKNDEAIGHLKKAFANNDMPLPVKMQLLGDMMGKPNSLANASVIAEKMVDANADDPKVQTLYADILYKEGKFKEAISHYQKAITLADDFYAGYEKLLGLQTLTEAYGDAISTADKALTIFPNQAILYYYRAFALHRTNHNAEAGLEIKNALSLESEDKDLLAMIYALQAEVLIDQQQVKAADLAFEKAIALAPKNYLVMSNYAYYLALRQHNLPSALQLAESAVKGLPNSSSAMDTYALVLTKMGRYAEAKQWQQKTFQNNGATWPVYLEHYGDILYLNNEKDEGLKYWLQSQQRGNTSEKLTKKINEKKYLK